MTRRLPARVLAALRDAGATLTRSHNHLVYTFPDGTRLSFAMTASCNRAEANMLADIRRVVRRTTQQGVTA